MHSMWKIIYFIMKMLPGHYAKMAMWVAMEKVGIVSLLCDEGYHIIQLLAFTNERFLMPWEGGGVCSLVKWQLLYWKSDIPSIGCDRFAVRNFIRERGLADILVPLCPDEETVWDDVESIDFSKLPNAFVLKCTNGSGLVEIVRDKTKLDIEKMKSKMKEWLESDISKLYREFQYAKVKNRIICEQLIATEDSKEPKDYKIMCSNGRPLFAWIDYDRFSGHERIYVDLDFVAQNVRSNFIKSRNGAGCLSEKPSNWARMLEVASILSKGIPIVRVDLYSENGHVYFGELTFTPGGGIETTVPFSFSQKHAQEADIREFLNMSQSVLGCTKHKEKV